MAAIKMAFDLQTPEGEPGSKSKVYEEMTAMSQQLLREPGRFGEFRDSYCCGWVDQWFDGQDEPGRITDALASLQFGEIAAAPIQDRRAFVIPMRLDPAAAPSLPKIKLGVPSPEHVDLEELLRRSTDSQGFMRAELHQVNLRLGEQAKLRSEQVAALDAAAANLDAVSDREERGRRFHVFLKDVESILGAESHAQFVAAMQSHFDAFFVH
jgi:hypothetical protein